MRKPRNITRHLSGLTLAMIGLMSWNVLPIHSSHRVVRTATAGSPAKPTVQPIRPAVANGKIAFASVNRGVGFLGIHTINPDGSDPRRLTSGPDVEPAWSPDGTHIAFVRYNGSTQGAIFVMNADGSNLRALTVHGGQTDRSPTWSPDGTKIAFSRFSSSFAALMIMNPDGSDEKVVQSGNLGSGNYYFQPAWSPDGSKLACQGSSGIYLINIDGTNPTRITQVSGINDYDSDPTWSPDGTAVAFTRWINCDFNDCESGQIWVVRADGSNPTRLKDGYYFSPEWSPDGTKIVFNNVAGLFLIRPDGSGFERIANTSGGDEFDPSWQPLSLNSSSCPNPINCAELFVRQHYLDFLNREPDPDGLAFWTNEITSCGGDAQCIDAKRTNVSAAYFLSIEFQQTGYLVYRIYKASYGSLPDAPVPLRLNEFLPDTREIGQGVVVNQAGWEQVLESNKQAFATAFVQRPRFTSVYPTSMSSEQFVDALFSNTGVTPAASDRTAAINEFAFAATTADVAARARALRRVAENSTLQQQEFNRAFVLMQYFGYLRRNPNDAPDLDFQGYNFWLNKLNQSNGDYSSAEMVKAFITSGEYRQRFGP